MPAEPFLGNYLLYESIFSGAVSRHELEKWLEPLDRGDAILLLSIINLLFTNADSPASIEIQADLSAELFDDDARSRISEHMMAAKQRSVVVVHRHQLLYLMKEVLIVCPEDGLRNNELTELPERAEKCRRQLPVPGSGEKSCRSSIFPAIFLCPAADKSRILLTIF